MSSIVVAVDGQAASGKSTVSRRVAEILDILYVDSGAVYRGVTWAALEQGVSCEDSEAVAAFAYELAFASHISGGAIWCRLNGGDPGEAIRSQLVNDNVSYVAAVPEVRKRVVDWLRNTDSEGSLVMEGRDIGTNVFPNADLKFYLDASPEERARRRTGDMNGELSMTDVAASLKRRDTIDSGRKVDPLKVAEDAEFLDTTGMSIEDVAVIIVQRVKSLMDSRASG